MPATDTIDAPTHRPSVWVLAGERVGDNQQLFRAADAMGLPYETKSIVLKPGEGAIKPKVEPSLHQVDLARSSKFEPPWPDLVITIGRRMSLVALWLKVQSGGRSKIALMNAPKGRTDAFDLLIVPAHYQVADNPRIMRIGLPLIAFDETRLAKAREETATTIGALPKPLHVLLLGGSTSHQKLDGEAACRIIDIMRRTFASTGTLFVSTSRRTPAGVAPALRSRMEPHDHLFEWSAASAGNPYAALLAHGDSFTVTGDSLSMLTEIARLGKPLVIAELPQRLGVLGFLKRTAAALANLPGLAPLARLASGERRDFGAFYGVLTAGGHAVFLGETLTKPREAPADDTALVGKRLRDLLGVQD